MDNQLDQQEVLNPEEGQDSNLDETVGDDGAKLKKAEEIAENQRIRAEKAEAKLKALKEKPEKETPKNENMSLKDIRALQDVHDDDVDDLADYAKYKNITIAEAKKTPAMIALLKAKIEERQTAQAANTGESRRGVTQVSDEQIVADAEAGKEVDPEKLAEARSNLRRAKKL